MTDPTAARDRAAVAIGSLANTTNEHAERILDWLQANPEVLRALAGVPTADVACDDVQLGAFGKPLGPCVKTGAHKVHDDGRGCTWWTNPPAAAPEGVDAATLCGRCMQRIRLVNGRWESEPDYGAACPLGGPHAPEGVDLEAQAAIQRVRDLTDQAELDHSRGWVVRAGAVLAALDGDTTGDEQPYGEFCHEHGEEMQDHDHDEQHTADELAEAERRFRRLVETRDHPDDFQDLRVVLAEYDRRGAELEAATEVAVDLATEQERLRARVAELEGIERAARSAMFDRPSAPGRDELRRLLNAEGL